MALKSGSRITFLWSPELAIEEDAARDRIDAARLDHAPADPVADRRRASLVGADVVGVTLRTFDLLEGRQRRVTSDEQRATRVADVSETNSSTVSRPKRLGFQDNARMA